jgi:hypothetical protein
VSKETKFLDSFLSLQCVWVKISDTARPQFFVTSKLFSFSSVLQVIMLVFPEKKCYTANYPDAVLSPGFPSTPGDEPESLSAAEQRLFHLQRQLDIETKAGHPLLTMHRFFSFTLIQYCGSMKFWYGSIHPIDGSGSGSCYSCQ